MLRCVTLYEKVRSFWPDWFRTATPTASPRRSNFGVGLGGAHTKIVSSSPHAKKLCIHLIAVAVAISLYQIVTSWCFNRYSSVPVAPVCDAFTNPSSTDSVCLVVCFLFLLGRPNCAGAVDEGRPSGVPSGDGERRGRGRSGVRFGRRIDCAG